MRKGAPHITIDPEFLEIFDEIASRLETPLVPRPTRSGLMNKAARLWIEKFQEEFPEMKPVIEGIQQRYDVLRRTEERRGKKKVVALRGRAPLAPLPDRKA